MSQKILIIDDEQIVVDSCRDILSEEDLEIESAEDGSRGLELCRAFRPDLVLLDLKMPGLSGMEVLDQIHACDPTVVVVVITGYATISSAVDAMKQGAYDFLPKPFTPDQLRLITRRGLEKRRLVRQTAELQAEKEMLRENFAAIVAHELASPLNAVLQNLFVLSRRLADDVADEERERLERMKERIKGLVGLVDTWRQTVSSDLDQVRERFARVPVADPIGEALENVEHQAVRKDVEIRVSLPDPSPEVFGDGATLTQALTNILGNAIKYSYAGSRVDLEVDETGGTVTVAISDHGIGISEDDLRHIFEDFYRAPGDTRSEPGAGLGLAIARRIVRIHDGSIRVESEMGGGSTFTIELPAIGGTDETAGRDGNPDQG